MKINLIILLVLTTAYPAWSQDYDSKINPIWHAQIGKCDYTLAVNSIASIQLQEYQDEDQNEVTELTIETVGGNNTRIFYRETPKKSDSPKPIEVAGLKLSTEELQKRAQELAQATGIPGGIESSEKNDGSPHRTSQGVYAKLNEISASSAAEVKNLHQELLKKWIRQD